MIRLLKNLKTKEWLMLALSVALIVGQVYLDLKLIDFMRDITAALMPASGVIVVKDILISGGWMLACAFGSLASAILVGFLVAKVATAFSARLRGKLFEKTLSFSMQEINNFSTASLITRTTNDVSQVQMFLAMGLQILIKAPIMAVMAIIKIAGKSWQFTAITAAAVAVILILLVAVMLFVVPKFKLVQKLTDNINRETRESLTGVRVVRSFNAENYQEEKFEKANEDLTKTQLFTSRMMSTMMPGISFVMSALSLAIYWVGAFLIEKASGFAAQGEIFADMMVFSSYAMQIIMAFMMVVMIFMILPRASVSAKRINEVLQTPLSLNDGTVTEGKAGLSGEVVFDNVCFKYPDAADYVLKDVSFTAKPGETVAFIGSTGSGKSTLINLIPRFYDATDGKISVDGVDIRDYTQEALRDKIGYVPQRAVMFAGSVSENVAYGEKKSGKPSEDDIKAAVEIAQAKDFVEGMEGGYDADVARGGTNVSGGQKQRLAIARAIARKPEIYVFDDSFSALDYKTDRVLRSKLAEETKGATKFIVAQRIGTIRDADRIIVLDNGNVVGQGTHDDLMQSCSVYQEIAYSQLSKEELING